MAGQDANLTCQLRALGGGVCAYDIAHGRLEPALQKPRKRHEGHGEVRRGDPTISARRLLPFISLRDDAEEGHFDGRIAARPDVHERE